MNKALIACINIKKIWSLTPKKGGAASYLIVDQSNPDKTYTGMCRQFIMHPKKHNNAEYEIFSYTLQNEMGIPSYEIFDEEKILKPMYSNDPAFRNIINTLHAEVFDLKYRNGGIQQWLL
jgi:hypothetical protein